MSRHARIPGGRGLKPFRRPWLWMGLWVGLIALIVIGSLMPGGSLPDVPTVSDKLQHFVGYFMLAAGAVQLFARRSLVFAACIAVAALGVGIEFAQGAFTSTRMADAGDVLANVVGILAGLATAWTPLRDLVLRVDGGGR